MNSMNKRFLNIKFVWFEYEINKLNNFMIHKQHIRWNHK